MDQTISLGTIGGVPVRMHSSVLFLAIIWVALDINNGGIEAVLFSFVFFLLVFGSILLHELGHSYAAKAFGIRTRDVILNFFGGVARLERSPKTLLAEAAIAFAGPAANLVLAALLYGVTSTMSSESGGTVRAMAQSLMVANLVLAAFNLLPGHPLDGGSLARSLLSTKMSRARARLIVARLGQSIAIALGLLGLAISPLSLPIAVFLFLAARTEARAAKKALSRKTAATRAASPRAPAYSRQDLAPPAPLPTHQGLRARMGLPRRTRM